MKKCISTIQYFKMKEQPIGYAYHVLIMEEKITP